MINSYFDLVENTTFKNFRGANFAPNRQSWQLCQCYQKTIQNNTVLPDVAIYRQTGDFREQAGDKIFEKIACDFCLRFGDF